MTVKRNLVANYISKFYVIFAGIAVLPLYLECLGAEAFGLVGFFSLLQAWIQLLDLGLSPTLGREVARLRGEEDRSQLCTIVKSLVYVFFVIAFLIVLVILLLSSFIAKEWLDFVVLDVEDVIVSICVMGGGLGIRWLATLYRSGINAFEQQVWLGLVDVAIVTLRFPIALLVIMFVDGDVVYFFLYQLIVTVIEFLVIWRKFYSLLPNPSEEIKFSISELKRIAPFASSLAYTGAIWILITQLDKMILSNVLSLDKYGYFTLIATISAGLMLLSGPVGQAILPRMIALLSQDKLLEMKSLYRKSTRWVVSVVTPVTLLIFLFPEKIVYIWTGDLSAARWVVNILPLYVLGSFFLTVAAFQYYLQYAFGDLKLHVKYNTISALISIPLIIYSALIYGPIGVAWVWLVFRFLSFAFWTPYVHRKFLPGFHFKWLFNDIFPPVVACFLCIPLVLYFFHGFFPVDRLLGFVAVIVTALSLMIVAFITSFYSDIRSYLNEKF